MTIRPVRLRHHVVYHVKAPDLNDRQRIIQSLIFPRYSISKNEIETLRKLSLKEFRSVIRHELQTFVPSQYFSAHPLYRSIVVYADEMRMRIHSLQKPCCRNSGSGTQFQNATTRLGRHKRTQERSYQGFGRHSKLNFSGFPFKLRNCDRERDVFQIFHACNDTETRQFCRVIDEALSE